MLKVVGASWHKTRISTYILLGSGFLVIAAFFIAEIERPQFDGTYCATIYWTEKIGFEVEYWKQRNDFANIPKGVARTCYKDSIYENGWAQLEVETQRTYPDWVQAFGAGILEGSLTWSNIYHQWSNTIFSACDRDEDSQNFCTWLRDILSSNYKSVRDVAHNHAHHDHYWHQVRLFYYHLEGLEAGFKRGAKRARSGVEEDIPFEDFILMNSAADIQDLKIYYENYVIHRSAEDPESEKNFSIPSAQMLLKMFRSKASGWKVLFGHSSAGSYSSMLRIQKRYKFRFHFNPDQKSNTVPGFDISFTGYPGILASTDDFYMVRGRQLHTVVAGVGIKNENLQLWKNAELSGVPPLSVRVMAANRLAQNRRTWAKVMSRHPVTGNKQWVMVDIKKIDSLALHSNSSQVSTEVTMTPKGVVWIVEQLPGRLHAKDMTDEFLRNGNSWIGNGTPYFEEILDASGISRENFSNDIRSENMTNLEAVERYLRSHAFRGDLLGEQSIPYGNIDIKLFSYDSKMGHSDFHAIAGPLFVRFNQRAQDDQPYDIVASDEAQFVSDYGDAADLEIISDRRPVRNDIRALAMRRIHGPFKWSAVDGSISGIKHTGHPDEWNFEKVSPKWAWHD